MALAAQGWLKVGRLVGCKGLQGELKLKPYDLSTWQAWQASGFKTLKTLRLSWDNKPTDVLSLTLRKAVINGTMLAVFFAEASDRTAAEKLLGAQVWVKKSDLPPLAQDEYRLDDLTDAVLMGVDAQGQPLCYGKVCGVVSSANGQDFLELEPAVFLQTSENPVLVPFASHFFGALTAIDEPVNVRQLTILPPLQAFLHSLSAS